MAGDSRWAVAYEKYIESRLGPSLGVAKSILREMRETEYWAPHADFIYGGPLARRKSSKERHPVPQPVHETKTRIKYLDTLLIKIRDEVGPEAPPTVATFDKIEDILGTRVVVYFPTQLAWVDHALLNDPRIELSTRPPKVFNDAELMDRIGLDTDGFDFRGRKLNGYSSIHYLARISDKAVAEIKKADHGSSRIYRPWFEIQVRTVAEELWGEIEHHVGYKSDVHTAFSVKRQFRVISDHLHAINMHLDFIYDEMQHHQANQEYGDADLLNAENIPSVLGEFLIAVPQDELGAVASILTAYRIRTIGELRAQLSYDTRQLVEGCWKKMRISEQPRTVDLMQTVCALPSKPKPNEVEAMVEAQIGVRQFRHDVEAG